MTSSTTTVRIDLSSNTPLLPWFFVDDPTTFPWERPRPDGTVALIDLRQMVLPIVVDLIRNWVLPTDFVIMDRREGCDVVQLNCGRIWAGRTESPESLARAVENRLHPGQRERAVEMVGLSREVNDFLSACIDRYPPSPLLGPHGLWIGHPGPDQRRDDFVWFASGNRRSEKSDTLAAGSIDSADMGGDRSWSTPVQPQLVAPAWAIDDLSVVLRQAVRHDMQLLRSESFHCVHTVSRQLAERGARRQELFSNLHRLVRVGGVLAVTWQTMVGRETMHDLVSDLLDATWGQIVMADMATLGTGERSWEPWASLAVRRIGPAVWR